MKACTLDEYENYWEWAYIDGKFNFLALFFFCKVQVLRMSLRNKCSKRNWSFYFYFEIVRYRVLVLLMMFNLTVPRNYFIEHATINFPGGFCLRLNYGKLNRKCHKMSASNKYLMVGCKFPLCWKHIEETLLIIFTKNGHSMTWRQWSQYRECINRMTNTLLWLSNIIFSNEIQLTGHFVWMEFNVYGTYN